MTEKDHHDLQKCKHNILVAVQQLYDFAYALGYTRTDVSIYSVEQYKLNEFIPRQIATVDVELSTKV